MPDPSRFARALIAPAMAASLGACAPHTAPSLSVTGVRVAQRTDAGLVIDFQIDARNVNSFALPLKRARYTVWLDDRRVFQGVRSPEASLRRLGTQRLHLPAAIPASVPLPHKVVRYRISGTLSYVRPGALAEVLFDAGIITPSTSFSHTGTIDLAGPTTNEGG